MNLKYSTYAIWIIFLLLSACKNDDNEIFAYGNFEADEIRVSPESSGRVVWLNLEEGILLKAGEKVIVIDTVQLQLRKEQLVTAIQTVQAKIRSIDEQVTVSQISIANIEREQKRITALFSEGAATEKQKDDMNGQLDVQKAQIHSLYAQKDAVHSEIASLQVQIAQTEDLIKRCYVVSPVEGVVLGKYINFGEIAVPGRTLFRIADMKNMELRVYVSGEQLSSIKTGDEVQVNVDSENKTIKTYEGIISWISDKSEFTPKIIQTRDERVNLVYPVKIRVVNDGYLKIGMPADISLINK